MTSSFLASPRFLASAGSICGFLGVAAGAFGAHGLKKILTPKMLVTFETGVRYHLIHALALLACAWMASAIQGTRLPPAAGWCFLIGIVLFSGSLYALALTEVRWLGAITPIGGVAFLTGWVCLLLAARQLPG